MRAIIVITALAFLLGSAGALAIEYQGQQVPVCGGFPGFVCGDKEWCDFPLGANCGIGDEFGTCRPRPEICTQQDIKVCGCDGETYSNSCLANMAGVDVAHAGACGKE